MTKFSIPNGVSEESLLIGNSKSKMNIRQSYASVQPDDPLYDDYNDDDYETDNPEPVSGNTPAVASTTSLPSPTGEFKYLKLQRHTVNKNRAASFSGEPEGFNPSSSELYGRKSISINNPSSVDRRLSSLLSLDELYKRVDSLRDMRPKKLIGEAHRLKDWSNYFMSDKELERLRNSKLKRFYQKQNNMIERYSDVDKLLDSGIHMSMIATYDVSTQSAEGTNVNMNNPPANIDLEGGKMLGYNASADDSIVSFAIWVTFIVNALLLLAKVVVVYLTRSMSIIASLVDSVLDFLSTLIIFFANKHASSTSDDFPIGKKRLEPLGVLVFSVIITVSFLQVLQQAIAQIIWGEHEIVHLTVLSSAIMISTIFVKVICFLWCQHIKNSSVQALAEDAKTDVVFNFFSIVFPTIGVLLKLWWCDSIGAALLCIYVIKQWCSIAFEHINNLTGAHADKEDYQEVLYLIMRFSENISKVKNFNIYHVGDLLNVEVDIVFINPSLSMKDCHDLGESLQYAIETLPFVERCFVHLDYKERNYIGHIN